MKNPVTPARYVVPGFLIGYAFGFLSPWHGYYCMAVGTIGGWVLATRMIRGWWIPALVVFIGAMGFSAYVMNSSGHLNPLIASNWARMTKSPVLSVQIALLAIWSALVLLSALPVRRGHKR